MALPTSYLSPAEQARLARKVGVTLPDGRVYRNGVIVSAQDSANSAATRARDAAFAAQTGQYAVRDGVNPNQAGQQAFDAYMGITRPNTKQNGPVGFQAVQSAPIIERPSTMGASWNPPRATAAQAAPAAAPSPTVAPAPALGSAWYDSEEFNTAVSTPGFDSQLTAYERAYSEAADRGDDAAKRGFASAAETTRRMRDAQGFMQGGYTGPGAPSKPAGIVHAGEFVIPADKVKEIGVRKLDAYFGTDSSKPKTGYQEGGYVAELMAYQSLFPNRNYSQENLARIANMPGGEQILMAQVLEARRAVAERQQQEQVARAEATADSRQNRVETQSAQSAVFLRTTRIPQADAEFVQADANVALAQEKVNEMLVPAASMAYDAALKANEPWLFVETGGFDENGMPALRPMTKQEFAGAALSRVGPARAATEAQLKEGPNGRAFINVQRELATAQSQFKMAERSLQSANQEYQRVAQFDPVNVAPAEAEVPAAPVPMLQAGPTVEQRQSDARAIQAAGDAALALGINPGGTVTNVTTPTGALPQGSVGFQAADGTYRVLLPGQEWEDAQSFPSEAAAAAYFQGAAEAQASAGMTGGDFVEPPQVRTETRTPSPAQAATPTASVPAPVSPSPMGWVEAARTDPDANRERILQAGRSVGGAVAAVASGATRLVNPQFWGSSGGALVYGITPEYVADLDTRAGAAFRRGDAAGAARLRDESRRVREQFFPRPSAAQTRAAKDYVLPAVRSVLPATTPAGSPQGDAALDAYLNPTRGYFQ